MPKDQLTMFEADSCIHEARIEKIYVSRGKNTVNENGEICDRYCGVVIGGKIHWIDSIFANFDDLRYILNPLGIVMCAGGVWGDIRGGDGITTPIDKKVVKLRQGESELFGSDSSYMDRSKRNERGTIWWTTATIKAKYFSQEAA